MSAGWSALFGLSVSPLEMVVRGTAMYWFLFLVFRIVVNEEELRAKLREHGVTDYAQVERAAMESDGQVSVIRREKGSGQFS